TVSAPTVSARSRRMGTGSVAMTLAPAAVAASVVASPMGPAPRMTTCSPAARPARSRACTAIDMGSMKAAGSGSRSPTPKTLGRRDGQQLLEPAVAMDPHQFQRHARVRAVGPARIAAPAAMQRPHGDPVPASHAARAVLADLLDDGAELVAL